MAGFGSRTARHGVLVAVALAAGVASAAGAQPVAAGTSATARFGTAAASPMPATRSTG
ncbi:hypothetical protein QP175_05300 [Sphingomonas aerolata]|uniref:hypothetical protein n=1 Tax=Sphingomonas aerolata TaxID=185951 RepID=UPI002FE0F8D6